MWMAAKLFEEKGNAGSCALIAKISKPHFLCWARTTLALTSSNHPVNASQIDFVEGSNQGLGTDEPYRGGDASQVVNPPPVCSRFDGHADPDIFRPRQTRGDSGESLRPFCQHLERMLLGPLHHVEDFSDVAFRHVSVEHVRHRVDEDGTRLLPAKR